MTTEQISCAPGNGNNEDLVAALEGAALTDLLVVDGASSVADTDYVNPQDAVLQEAMASLGLADMSDPDVRRARLLPMLRARREFQHGSPAPDVLCLAPQGEFKAREYALRLPFDATVLAMTDGFYRLVDPYERYTIEELAQRCRSCGLAALMDELRAFESARVRTACGQKRRRRLGAPVDEFPLPQLKENE